MIAFQVWGVPKPWQRPGAVTKVKRKDGTIRYLDRAIFFDRSDKTWHQLVYEAAMKVRPETPFEGPIKMTMVFMIPKPKSKPQWRVYSDTKPDLDNYAKGIQDVIRGVIYRDDGQIAKKDLDKKWGFTPGVHIVIEQIIERPSKGDDK